MIVWPLFLLPLAWAERGARRQEARGQEARRQERIFRPLVPQLLPNYSAPALPPASEVSHTSLILNSNISSPSHPTFPHIQPQPEPLPHPRSSLTITSTLPHTHLQPSRTLNPTI